MGNRFTTAQSTSAMRFWASRTVVAFAAVAALTAADTPAAAKKARPAQVKEAAAPRVAGEPVMAIVSIKGQQVTFYDADGWIRRAPVSTGTKSRETPAGVFAVIEKDKDHHSSLYDDAWMPNMLRITWNGIALHGGPLPGYPASHGCVRMPYGFAEGLFDKAWIGMRVIISPDDTAPVEFSHPALFEPDAAAVAAAPAHAATLAREAADAVKAASEAKKLAATAAREAAPAAAAVRKLEAQKAKAAGQLAAADKAIAAAEKAKAKAEDGREKAAAKLADLTAQLDAAKGDAASKLAAAAPAGDAATADDATKKAAVTAAAEAASQTQSLRKLELAQARAAAQVASAEKALAAAEEAKAHAEDLKQKAAARVAELATELDAAKDEAKAKLDAAAAAKAAAAAAKTQEADAAKAAAEAKLLLEPVSVYISRATGKLYVRRNTHKPWSDGGVLFDSSIEVPVTIRDPDRPIGTHIFTAVAQSGAGLRWTAVTIDNGDDARDALDRITIPKDVLTRIAPTALPLSSIIVSDEPLSRETNYRTEFVAVLHDQPQGGFLMRKPTVTVPVAKPAVDVPIVRMKRPRRPFFQFLFSAQ
jgi:hypothetical protein